MNIGSVFTIFSLFYAVRSLQIARIVWQNWTPLQAKSLIPAHKSLADQASFFLAVPMGVFFHEGAHALAVLFFGGTVVKFNYLVFWGSVDHFGAYAPVERWFISLAGTLGSLLFGLVFWLFLRRHPAPTFQYFGVRSFRFQIFFSLIYYPVFTLLGFYGDWRTIYDFNATPTASGITAVFHVLFLALFFWADRRGFFQMAAFGETAELEQLAARDEHAAANPQDIRLQLERIEEYRQRGLTQQARQALRQFLKENPQSAEGHLQLAVLSVTGQRQISPQARKSAEEALRLGLAAPAAEAYAHQLLGQYNLDVGKLAQAFDHFDQGLQVLKTADRPDLTAHLNYLQALTYRRQGRYDQAEQSVQQAISLAQSHKLEQQLSLYESERETIAHHRGK